MFSGFTCRCKMSKAEVEGLNFSAAMFGFVFSEATAAEVKVRKLNKCKTSGIGLSSA